MKHLVRHAFLALGIVTLLGFAAVEVGATWLAPIVRLLIAPIWIMRTLEMVVGFGAMPDWLDIVLGVPLLLTPYVLLDALVARLRNRHAKTHPARRLTRS